MCDSCSDAGDCLISCDSSKYQDRVCYPCSDTCDYGCVRPNDCKLNTDELCQTYDSFTSCTQCVNLTVSQTLPCKCVNQASYNIINDSCLCQSNTFAYNNTCFPCVRWLNSSEIFASFTNTFLKIKIVFSLSVYSTNCQLVFNAKTLEKFGLGYSCMFSNDNTELIVTLGYGFTIQNETISLNSSYLYGRSNECGYFQSDLKVNVIYAYALPVPSAVIIVPPVVYYECQSLVIDGSQSYGGFLTILYQ